MVSIKRSLTCWWCFSQWDLGKSGGTSCFKILCTSYVFLFAKQCSFFIWYIHIKYHSAFYKPNYTIIHSYTLSPTVDRRWINAFNKARGVGQVSYGGVQLWGKPDSENIPYFREISQSRAPEAVRTPKTYPILGKISQFRAAEVVRTPKTYPIFGKFDKIIPYFREIW